MIVAQFEQFHLAYEIFFFSNENEYLGLNWKPRPAAHHIQQEGKEINNNNTELGMGGGMAAGRRVAAGKAGSGVGVVRRLPPRDRWRSWDSK